MRYLLFFKKAFTIVRIFVINLFIVFSCASLSYGQRTSSFGAFISSPVGSFKSTDLSDGGFAKTGWGIVFDSDTKLKFLDEHFSLHIHSTYQWNDIDTEKLSESYTDALGFRTEVSESRYRPILTTVGPGYNIDFGNERMSIGILTGVGVLFNNTKAFTVTVFDDSDQELTKELVNFDNNVAFAYMFGAEFIFSIVPDLFKLSIYSDYMSSNQKVEASFSNSTEQVKSFESLNYLNYGVKIVLLSQ